MTDVVSVEHGCWAEDIHRLHHLLHFLLGRFAFATLGFAAFSCLQRDNDQNPLVSSASLVSLLGRGSQGSPEELLHCILPCSISFTPLTTGASADVMYGLTSNKTPSPNPYLLYGL